MTTTIHDSGYKRLFSNRTIFRQLIETFVREEWVRDLDFSQAETLDKSFVSEHYKETESDLIYKVKFRGREAYLVVLLEFQSGVERFMALRMLNYVTNFYMDYVKSTDKVKLLPPVFPIVLYNGKERWTAPEKIEALIQDVTRLGTYAPRFRYCKLVERDYPKEDLLTIRNLVSTLFLTDAHYERELILDELVEVFVREDDRQAAELLVSWFLMLVEHGYVPKDAGEEFVRKFRTAQEVRSMLVEALEKERKRLVARDLQKVRDKALQKGREEGREEGRKQGELIGSIRVLQRILRRPISDETELLQKEQADLQKMLQELEDALKDAPLLS